MKVMEKSFGLNDREFCFQFQNSFESLRPTSVYDKLRRNKDIRLENIIYTEKMNIF